MTKFTLEVNHKDHECDDCGYIDSTKILLVDENNNEYEYYYDGHFGNGDPFPTEETIIKWLVTKVFGHELEIK